MGWYEHGEGRSWATGRPTMGGDWSTWMEVAEKGVPRKSQSPHGKGMFRGTCVLVVRPMDLGESAHYVFRCLATVGYAQILRI